VAVKIVASGAQAVSVYTQSPTGQSSYITVVTPNVMVTVHDQVAMRTCAEVWTDMRPAALHLPKFRRIEVEKVARRMPGLVIAAHGADRTCGVHRTDQNDIVIRIGYLTWILADNLAFRSMTEAWERAQEAGEKVLPTSPTAKTDTNRRRVLPRPTHRFL
jgi:hypothetical protein